MPMVSTSLAVPLQRSAPLGHWWAPALRILAATFWQREMGQKDPDSSHAGKPGRSWASLRKQWEAAPGAEPAGEGSLAGTHFALLSMELQASAPSTSSTQASFTLMGRFGVWCFRLSDRVLKWKYILFYPQVFL